ncbi:MAG: hypothetical protein MJE77_38095 [Proteobacteria bacterium]|nr:hypothetical protein [Pseudomonadota bacterium]
MSTYKQFALANAFAVGLSASAILASTMLGGCRQDHYGHSHHGDPTMPAEHNHVHEPRVLAGPAETMPGVDLIVHRDPMSGWNLQLVTKNFRFAPGKASTEYRDGEGHAHVFVDGKKLSRVYENWYHIGSLAPGERKISVELSGNDHTQLRYGDAAIADTETVTAAAGKHVHSAHQPRTLDGPENALPSIDLVVHRDPKSGWNLQLVTKNFRFAPDHVSTGHRDGEGHAHLYVDGKKLTRVYGEWHYLGPLAAGKHEIAVELSANDHSPLFAGKTAIRDKEVVKVD